MLTMFPSLIENVASRASDFGLSVIEHRPTCSCALHFDYGLKVRPFFPKLIEPMDVRLDAMSSQGVDHQVLSAWADIFDHGMPRQNAVAWHSYLNNHLAKVCELRPERFSLLASVPFPFAQESAAELERAAIKLGAVGAVIAANVEGTILGNLRLQEKLQEIRLQETIDTARRQHNMLGKFCASLDRVVEQDREGGPGDCGRGGEVAQGRRREGRPLSFAP